MSQNIKRYSRFASKGAVFADIFIRNVLEKLVYEKGDPNWVEYLPLYQRKKNKTEHSTIKLTSVKSSLKKWGYCKRNSKKQKGKKDPTIPSRPSC